MINKQLTSILLLFVLIFLSGCIGNNAENNVESKEVYSTVTVKLEETGNAYYLNDLKNDGIYLTVDIDLPKNYEKPDKICITSLSSPIWDIDINNLCVGSENYHFTNGGDTILVKFGHIKIRNDIPESLIPETVQITVALYYNVLDRYLIEAHLSDDYDKRRISIKKMSKKYTTIDRMNIIKDPSNDQYNINIIVSFLDSPNYEIVSNNLNVRYIIAALIEDILPPIENIKNKNKISLDIPIDAKLYTLDGKDIDRTLDIYLELSYNARELYNVGYIDIIK